MNMKHTVILKLKRTLKKKNIYIYTIRAQAVPHSRDFSETIGTFCHFFLSKRGEQIAEKQQVPVLGPSKLRGALRADVIQTPQQSHFVQKDKETL